MGGPHVSDVVWCGVWCGVVWCGVVWCGVVWCGVVWCGVVWCGVVWCGVVWCGVVWCGVVWCGVVWCGVVVWCVYMYIYIYIYICIYIYSNSTHTYRVCLQRVRLDFLSVNLPECKGCSDKVKIYDGRSATARVIKTLSGSDQSGHVTSSWNKLFVHFESDSTERSRSFRIQYTIIGKYFVDLDRVSVTVVEFLVQCLNVFVARFPS